MTVGRRDAWERARLSRQYLAAKPSPSTFYGDFIWQSRIGRLMPGGQDRWCDVRAGARTTEIAEDVVRAIRDHALPAMRNKLAERGDVASTEATMGEP